MSDTVNDEYHKEDSAKTTTTKTTLTSHNFDNHNKDNFKKDNHNIDKHGKDHHNIGNNHKEKNTELFENAPPYMIIRPYLKEGLYISSGQISKLPVKLTCIHVQL